MAALVLPALPFSTYLFSFGINLTDLAAVAGRPQAM